MLLLKSIGETLFPLESSQSSALSTIDLPTRWFFCNYQVPAMLPNYVVQFCYIAPSKLTTNEEAVVPAMLSNSVAPPLDNSEDVSVKDAITDENGTLVGTIEAGPIIQLLARTSSCHFSWCTKHSEVAVTVPRWETSGLGSRSAKATAETNYGGNLSSPKLSIHDALKPSMKALVQDSVLKHSYVVKVAVGNVGC